MDIELIWAPGVTLCDGIAYEYADEVIVEALDDLIADEILPKDFSW